MKKVLICLLIGVVTILLGCASAKGAVEGFLETLQTGEDTERYSDLLESELGKKGKQIVDWEILDVDKHYSRSKAFTYEYWIDVLVRSKEHSPAFKDEDWIDVSVYRFTIWEIARGGWRHDYRIREIEKIQ